MVLAGQKRRKPRQRHQPSRMAPAMRKRVPASNCAGIWAAPMRMLYKLNPRRSRRWQRPKRWRPLWPLSFLGEAEDSTWVDSMLTRGSEAVLYSLCGNGLCSDKRGFHANARHQSTACTGHQALVAVARAEHLPAAVSSRAAHPHST